MDPAEMARRLTVLEDIEAIKTLQHEYMACHDNLEFQRILDFFTDDAEVKVRDSGWQKGRENFAQIFLNLQSRRTERHDGHLVGEPVITVNGNTACARWTVYIFFSVPTIDWVQGRNDCEYVKIEGRWKISKLSFRRTLASRPELYP